MPCPWPAHTLLPCPGAHSRCAAQMLAGMWEPYPIDMAFQPPCMVLSTIGLAQPGKIRRVRDGPAHRSVRNCCKAFWLVMLPCIVQEGALEIMDRSRLRLPPCESSWQRAMSTPMGLGTPSGLQCH